LETVFNDTTLFLPAVAEKSAIRFRMEHNMENWKKAVTGAIAALAVVGFSAGAEARGFHGGHGGFHGGFHGGHFGGGHFARGYGGHWHGGHGWRGRGWRGGYYGYGWGPGFYYDDYAYDDCDYYYRRRWGYCY
jgi:hypothetical protein